jgi:hypothetical protein
VSTTSLSTPFSSEAGSSDWLVPVGISSYGDRTEVITIYERVSRSKY